MTQALNVQKKHIVEYAYSGWFYGSDGVAIFHNVLAILGVHYSTKSDCEDYENDFEIERESLERGLEKLRAIDQGQEADWVDIEYLTERLGKANITLSECITCFEWLLNNSEKEHEKDWIYVSFF